ncbi:BTB/POZ and MATH domain-containing protein 2-like [Panicum virgatum]|uniref:BTB/POZ and MATH domain-containing protein 2-like n=1 Tax=Panicum virgatum TaxID=38727 RepID=UPI0019D66DC6|nr:BTB/POZ and MATH domain-containing protein 2-like [Panicum virgatum]
MVAAPEIRPMTRTSSTYIAETARGTHSFKVSMKRGTAAAGAYVSSDTFVVGGHDWRIRCYPRGSYSKTHVGVFLDVVSEGGGIEVEVLCDFRLLNRATKVFSSVLSVERLSKPSKGPWGSPFFMSRSLLGASYLQDDGCIVIGCDITVVRQSLVEETVEVQVPPSDLSDDLGKLLESGVGADVTFEVKGEVFHAHKIVLAARSPVFKELIYGSTGDNETVR